MFTGIVEETGEVVQVQTGDESLWLTIRGRLITSDLEIGSSVAVDGVCLTVIEVHEGILSVEAGAETLRRTTLGRLRPGVQVNLERPVRADQRLGGHMVQGHVDGVGTIIEIAPEGSSVLMEIAAPRTLLRYIVDKGSVAVDGISLTVAAIRGDGFAVALIPYTLAATTLGRKQLGGEVNIEVDILAKYVERLAAAYVEPVRRRTDG